VSEFSKDELVSTLGVDPERVSVVYNGIDDRFFDDTPGDPIDTPEQFVLYVGAMNPRKNVSGLVEAYRRIRDDIKEELVLVGPRNKDIFESLEVEEADDVHMPGFVSQEELVYLYDEASVFVYPSFYEGFGLPPLEAIARGTSVVASDRTALPEVLGKAAEYVDPDDTASIASGIQRVISEMNESACDVDHRLTADSYRWDQSISSLGDIIAKTV
jgi:glycosyltransferase involved in cell wall biosynthesis